MAMGVTNCESDYAYAFGRDDVLCHLHAHNRVFPLLDTVYIVVVTHERTKGGRAVLSEQVRL